MEDKRRAVVRAAARLDGADAGGLVGLDVVNAMGWKAFFWLTIVAGIPGLLLLHRFAPLGVREPTLAESA